jgi:hypothetical protein
MTDSKRSDFAMTPEQRVSARAALKILDGTGISLEEAARRAVRGQRALSRISARAAVDEYLRTLLARKARLGTYSWSEQRLTKFADHFDVTMLDDIDRPSLQAWLAGVTKTEPARRHYAKAARSLFLWALRHEPPLIGADITFGLVPKKHLKETEVKFLSVAECADILAGAGPYQSAIALGLFAGLRPEEIAGQGKQWMEWKHIDVAGKIVRVPAEVSKTRKPRPLEGLPDALWAWLKPGDAYEPVSPGRARQIARVARDRAGYGLKEKKGKWPVDAIRHTFATYAVALLGEGGKVANWLGHEADSSMLYRHYRGLTTKAEAEKFWALRPS